MVRNISSLSAKYIDWNCITHQNNKVLYVRVGGLVCLVMVLYTEHALFGAWRRDSSFQDTPIHVWKVYGKASMCLAYICPVLICLSATMPMTSILTWSILTGTTRACQLASSPYAKYSLPYTMNYFRWYRAASFSKGRSSNGAVLFPWFWAQSLSHWHPVVRWRVTAGCTTAQKTLLGWRPPGYFSRKIMPSSVSCCQKDGRKQSGVQ